MASIFMSYRREDTAPYAGRLYDRLAAQFGKDQIFIDVDRIQPGDDFAEIIERTIAAARVLLVVIGRQWAGVAGDTGARRLDDPDDFVRLEVLAALSRDLRVIPVLVGGAAMPRAEDLPEPLRPLVRRLAFELSDARFHADTDRLIENIERRKSRRRTARAHSRRWLYVAGAAAAIAVALTFFAVRHTREPDRGPSARLPDKPQLQPKDRPKLASAFKGDAKAKLDAAAFEAANAMRRAGNYAAAIPAFRAFIAENPNSPLAHRAQYWIGESHYNLRDFRSAIASQQQLIAAYPDSPSVPDALFNIGAAHIELGDTAQAKKTFATLLERYPQSEAAQKARRRLVNIR